MASFYEKTFGWKTQMLGPDMGDYVRITCYGVTAARRRDHSGETAWRAYSATALSAKADRVGPSFLPLFDHLHPKLHRVHRGSRESACIRPGARRTSAGQGF